MFLSLEYAAFSTPNSLENYWTGDQATTKSLRIIQATAFDILSFDDNIREDDDGVDVSKDETQKLSVLPGDQDEFDL